MFSVIFSKPPGLDGPGGRVARFLILFLHRSYGDAIDFKKSVQL